MRCLLAFALVLVCGQASAARIPFMGNFYDTWEAAYRANSAFISDSSGLQFRRTFNATYGGVPSRGLVPFNAAGTLTRSNLLRGVSVLCVTNPVACRVGAVAATLGATLLIDQTTGQLFKNERQYSGTWGSNDSITQITTGTAATAGAGWDACLAAVTAKFVAGGANRSTQWAGAAPTVPDPLVINTSYSRYFQYLVNGTPTTGPNSYLCRYTPTANAGEVASPATVDEAWRNMQNTTSNWQSTQFADVFRDAVTKGATWPITIYDPATLTQSPTQPARTIATSTTTNADGTTSTTTTTSQPIASCTGTTIGTAACNVTERTTTTTTSSGQTVTTTTDADTQAGGGVVTADTQPTAATQTNTCGSPGQAPCQTQEVGTFAPPSTILPGVPAAPTFTESFQRLATGISQAPIVAIADGLSLPTGASCPTYSGTFPFVGALTFDVHCQVAEGIRGILAAVCILIAGILGIRRVLSA